MPQEPAQHRRVRGPPARHRGEQRPLHVPERHRPVGEQRQDPSQRPGAPQDDVAQPLRRVRFHHPAAQHRRAAGRAALREVQRRGRQQRRGRGVQQVDRSAPGPYEVDVLHLAEGRAAEHAPPGEQRPGAVRFPDRDHGDVAAQSRGVVFAAIRPRTRHRYPVRLRSGPSSQDSPRASRRSTSSTTEGAAPARNARSTASPRAASQARTATRVRSAATASASSRSSSRSRRASARSAPASAAAPGAARRSRRSSGRGASPACRRRRSASTAPRSVPESRVSGTTSAPTRPASARARAARRSAAPACRATRSKSAGSPASAHAVHGMPATRSSARAPIVPAVTSGPSRRRRAPR
ncbi:hypothetical protein LUX05_24360 [Streptomyces somaliensis]|nr:hypothetical protein [Streptomyces somaliensis]